MCLSTVATDAAAADTQSTFARLPTNVAPRKYFLEYAVDLARCRFDVAQRIELSVREPTRRITCHALELYVFNVSVALADETRVACTEVRYVEQDQSVELTFAQELPVGDAVLSLECHGFLNDKLRGFYRSEYTQDGEKRLMAVTQFEACDARRAFVCWDEPAVKAKYEIAIVTDPSLTAISNTHVVQTLVRPTKDAHLRTKTRTSPMTEKVWRFAETPIMSTYLVGMVVGEFDAVTDITSDGVLVTVYTPVGRSARGQFALDVGVKALAFFSERFGIAYPLKKLDMLAIPDFAAGAMENWGVVTYRETRLLIDGSLSSFAQKMATARTVCHELAHQWFGNLVTMEWWTGLWLNEGFARFMEFEAVHHIFPDWHVWDLFVQEITLSTAMVKDAMKTSHPIEVVVHHPDEVDQIFDVISYAKGASVIRMLSEFLGRDVFYRGIHDYLVAFSYRNAQTEDLWRALEAASGQKITAMANTWTSQMGYPVLTLADSGALSQQRFLSDAGMKDADTALAVWDVPLTFRASHSAREITQVGIWQGKSAGHTSPPPAITDQLACPLDANTEAQDQPWVLLNPNQAGFYLVNYSPAAWTRLQRPVRELTLDTVDRVSLLNSIFSFARSGVVSVTQALDFSRAYADEPEHLCWKELSTNLGYYAALFRDEPCAPQLQRYVRELFAGVMKRLSWTAASDEPSSTGHFRRDVIAMLGRAEDEAVVREAQRLFQLYMADRTGAGASLAADLRGTVFTIAAVRGDASHVAQLRAVYEESDFIEEKLDCLSAIGRIASLETKREVLEWARASVRSQDIQYVFASVAGDAAGARMTWAYVQDQWAALNAQYAPLMVGRIVLTTIARFQSEAQAQEVERFLATRKHHSYDRLLDASLERIRIKAACFQRDREALAAWLATSTTA